MMKVKEIVLFGLFVLGMISTALLGLYVYALIIFVFDESITYPGEIAFIPKWIFLFSPFVLLGRREKTKETLEKFLVFILGR